MMTGMLLLFRFNAEIVVLPRKVSLPPGNFFVFRIMMENPSQPNRIFALLPEQGRTVNLRQSSSS